MDEIEINDINVDGLILVIVSEMNILIIRDDVEEFYNVS